MPCVQFRLTNIAVGRPKKLTDASRVGAPPLQSRTFGISRCSTASSRPTDPCLREWLATPEGRALSTDPDAIALADVAALGRLLTSLVRGERFGDGTLASAHGRGILTAILRRAAELKTGERPR